MEAEIRLMAGDFPIDHYSRLGHDFLMATQTSVYIYWPESYKTWHRHKLEFSMTLKIQLALNSNDASLQGLTLTVDNRHGVQMSCSSRSMLDACGSPDP